MADSHPPLGATSSSEGFSYLQYFQKVDFLLLEIKLVISTLWRNCVSIAVEADAVARWERDDPRRWASVQHWLLGQGITLTVLRTRLAASGPPPPRSEEPQPPSTGLQG